jgi:hypothetical protein
MPRCSGEGAVAAGWRAAVVAAARMPGWGGVGGDESSS